MLYLLYTFSKLGIIHSAERRHLKIKTGYIESLKMPLMTKIVLLSLEKHHVLPRYCYGNFLQVISVEWSYTAPIPT